MQTEGILWRLNNDSEMHDPVLPSSDTKEAPMSKHLYIVWTNADPVTSENMVFMYASNSMKNGWWDDVTVVIWGSPQDLLCEDAAIRVGMEAARGLGVEFSACLTCADKLGRTEQLRAMGLEVVRWGAKLSGLLQSGAHVITV